MNPTAYCLLNNGHIARYHAAYRIDSKAKVSTELVFIGIGMIYSCDGNRYKSDKLFKFYISKRWKKSAKTTG